MDEKEKKLPKKLTKENSKVRGMRLRRFLFYIKSELKIPTKKITYTAILSSISVAIVILITTYTPLVAYPGFRIAFEGVLIKIGGFAFGPVIGVLMGLVTEILVILLRPSIIHPGYTIAIVLYGLFGGFCKLLSSAKKLKRTVGFWSLGILLISVAIGIAILFSTGGGLNGSIPIFSSAGSSTGILPIPATAGLGLIIFSVFFVAMFYFVILFVFKKEPRKSKLSIVLPVFFLSILTEYFVSVLIIPWADRESLQLTISYASLFIARIIIAPYEIVFNTVIIYFVWKTLSPLLKKADATY